MKLIKLLTFFLTFLFVGISNAEVPLTQCQINWNKGQQLASNQLWDKFEATTKSLIRNCAEELPYRMLYADLAEAQGEQKKFKESLVSAEKCLSYGIEPECHLRRVMALKALGFHVLSAKQDALIACRQVDPKSIEGIGCKRIIGQLKSILD